MGDFISLLKAKKAKAEIDSQPILQEFRARAERWALPAKVSLLEKYLQDSLGWFIRNMDYYAQVGKAKSLEDLIFNMEIGVEELLSEKYVAPIINACIPPFDEFVTKLLVLEATYGIDGLTIQESKEKKSEQEKELREIKERLRKLYDEAIENLSEERE